MLKLSHCECCDAGPVLLFTERGDTSDNAVGGWEKRVNNGRGAPIDKSSCLGARSDCDRRGKEGGYADEVHWNSGNDARGQDRSLSGRRAAPDLEPRRLFTSGPDDQ